MRRRPTIPDQNDPDIIALSGLLNRYAQKIGSTGDHTFRNPNGVSMKVANLSRHDPDDERAGLPHGAGLEAEIWAEFGHNPERLASVAAAIRTAIEAESAEIGSQAGDDDDGTEEAAEGRILTRLHRSRERNRKLVQTKKTRAMRGSGFMEAHHTRPVHEITPGQATKLTDLALVCANCHRMIHARRPWLTMGELRAILGPCVRVIQL